MKHATIPCAECPWRTDVPTGKFPPSRFEALAGTAYDMAKTVFACHMSKEGGEFACAGFLLQSSVHNMACRMARRSFDVSSPHPLFQTYRDMAVANGMAADHPALRDCRDDGQRARRGRPKRKAIPLSVKCEVLRRQRAHCAECKQPLWPSDPTEYDHRPSLILREINAAGTDYVPPQNDPDHIEALHTSCHQKRTTGRRPGAERTVTTKGSDIHLKAKFNRLEGRTKIRPKVKIPQRKNPWPKRKFRT